MKVETVLARLDEEMLRVARDAVETPREGTSYEYGRMIGLYAGLALAKETVVNLYADKDERDRHM